MNLVLLSVYLLYLGFVRSECISFKCTPADVRKVNQSGNVMTCPNDRVCNLKPTSPCVPCVDCSEIYRCDPEITNLVMIDDLKLYCLEGYRCNSKYVMPCDPCVRKQCPHPPNFTCVTDTEIDVDDELLTCASGFVCNPDYLHPCYPCIGEEDFQFSRVITFKPTSKYEV